MVMEKLVLSMSALPNAASCSWREMHNLDNCPLSKLFLAFSVTVVKFQ